MESFTRKTSEKSMGNSSLMEVSNTIDLPGKIANITFTHLESKGPDYISYSFYFENKL